MTDTYLILLIAVLAVGLVSLVANCQCGRRAKRANIEYRYMFDSHYARAIETEILTMCIYIRTLEQALEQAVCRERFEEANVFKHKLLDNMRTLEALQKEYEEVMKELGIVQ